MPKRDVANKCLEFQLESSAPMAPPTRAHFGGVVTQAVTTQRRPYPEFLLPSLYHVYIYIWVICWLSTPVPFRFASVGLDEPAGLFCWRSIWAMQLFFFLFLFIVWRNGYMVYIYICCPMSYGHNFLYFQFLRFSTFWFFLAEIIIRTFC